MSMMQTLPYLIGLMGAGKAGMQVLGGKREASAYRQAAAESRNTAVVTQVAGDKAVFDYTRHATMLEGQTQEGFAAGGVTTTTGSPLEVKMEDARLAKYNIATIQYDTALKVRSLNYNANLQDYAARQTSASSLITAGSGLITSGLSGYYASKLLPLPPKKDENTRKSPFDPSLGMDSPPEYKLPGGM